MWPSAAGVSIATASKALNDTGRIGRGDPRPGQARRRRASASVPTPWRAALLAKRSFTIGLLTNDTYGRFTLPVMAGDHPRRSADHGISVFLCAIEDDPALGQVHVEAMLDKQVDGIIASGKRVDRRLPVDLAGPARCPVVYAFTEGTPDAVTLRSDDAQGARLAVEHLLRLGRRRIAHVTGPESFFSVRERAAPIRAVAGDAIARPVRLLVRGLGPRGRRPALGRRRARARRALLRQRPDRPRRHRRAARARPRACPSDVSVVGFDNWEIMAAQTRPPLTTVDMNLKELGRQAGLIVRALAEGEAVEPGRAQAALPAGGAGILRGGPRDADRQKPGQGRRHHEDTSCLAATALAALRLAPTLAAAEDVEMWVRTGIGDVVQQARRGLQRRPRGQDRR